MSQYATREELAKWGLRANVLAAFTEAEQDAHLQAASAVFESYALNRGYAFPLATWGDDLRMSVVRVAAWTLLTLRGASPSNPADEGVAKAHDDAISWWRDIARGVANLNISTPDRGPTGVPEVFDAGGGSGPRGW